MPAAATRAAAQSALDTENGRYTLSPVADDYLRLDTRTGAVSTCSNKDGWVCRAVPDERSALDAEIGKLQAENKSLKEQLAQRDSSAKANVAPKSDDKKGSDSIDESFDRLRADNQKLLALIDRMWDRLIEMAGRVQKKLSEKI
ncbi:MAG: hypothetical protein J0I29_05855 [Rhizobiales bacterium]|nr:hypothetical protein [Hyphomicrobiales bacterium]